MIKLLKRKYLTILLLAFWPLTGFYYFRKLNWQDLFEIIRSIRFIMLLMTIGLIAFTFIPQGQHMLMSLGQPLGQVWQNIFILIALFYWSYQVYYGARILLKLSNLRYDSNGILRLYTYRMITPVVIGITPYWIVIAAYLRANGLQDGWDYSVVVFLLILMIGICWYYYYRAHINNAIEMNPHKSFEDLKGELIDELHPIAFNLNIRYNFFFLIGVFSILIIGFTVLSIIGISVLQMIGPTAIVITSLAAWISMTNTIAIINTKYFKYFSSVLVVLFLISSNFNNNNRVYLLDKEIPERISVKEYYKNWKEKRTATSTSETYPVFVIAIEGGGSRSAYWAGSVLSGLSDRIPEFSDHVFAISAVSGGSLGSVVYQTLLRQHSDNRSSDSILPVAREILKKDFLSPITASLGYPDMLQQFIPFEISVFDRAKALERSWEKACSDVIPHGKGENPLKRPFHDLWNGGAEFELPALFINATWVETGRRVIMSNLMVDEVGFSNSVDLFSVIDKEIKLSTAVSLSSRFPYITPAGGIFPDKKNLWGHVSDGGYFDNSGITTAGEIISIINNEIIKQKSKVLFTPYLIIISSRSNYYAKAGSFYEFTEPLVTLINETLDGSVSYARSRVMNQNHIGGVIDIKLQLPLNDVPLGWYLSDYSVNKMNQRIDEIIDFQERRIRKILN